MSIEVYRILVRLSFFLELSPKKTHAKTHTYTHTRKTQDCFPDVDGCVCLVL